MLYKVIHKCLDLIFPRFCLACGAENFDLCPKCIALMPPSEGFLKTKHCGIILSASSYKIPTMEKIIRAFKYKNRRELRFALSDIVLRNINYFNAEKREKHIFVPVPISKKKKRKRGYNQSELLAETLSRETGIPVQKNILFKKFHTLSQVETKTRAERIKNMKNSFCVNEKEDMSAHCDSTVILVDDIATTGATINEAARVLKNAGFKNIIAITVARG